MTDERGGWRRLVRDYGPYLPLSPYLFVVLFPFYWMVITAFKRDKDLYNLDDGARSGSRSRPPSRTWTSCSSARCS